MPGGANLPSIEQVLELAEGRGFELSAGEARGYCNLVPGELDTTRRLDGMVGFRPPVTYPRTPGSSTRSEGQPLQR